MDITFKIMWSCVMIAAACSWWAHLRKDDSTVGDTEKKATVITFFGALLIGAGSVLVRIWQ
ncbi:MAG: hypothetical protein GY738_27275 [Pseudoalteromonas sp.]|nr:hypothetical protein [Pseudoalteromonas sp.]